MGIHLAKKENNKWTHCSLLGVHILQVVLPESLGKYVPSILGQLRIPTSVELYKGLINSGRTFSKGLF